ncbi:hypothetical protein GF386_02360 [Candidatus Pacearchaeota archaeon]|nr:hypothetical protein [Candidatus Pacearchaeota archaeon]MBD3283000.1 hypothetical protein [Candidatus Pacearchaeota archaeon]
MPKKKTKKTARKRNNKNDERILFAFLATFLSIIGFVIAIITKRKDKYVMFYAKQSLVIFIIAIIVSIIQTVLFWIPIIGKLIYYGLSIIIFIIWVTSWIYALTGKQRDIPFISIWSKKIDL